MTRARERRPPGKPSPPAPESAATPQAAGGRAGARAWLPGLGLYLVLALAALVYQPGLSGDLVLDDHPNLAPVQAVASGDLAWQDYVFDPKPVWPGRPLAKVSFLANWAVSDGDVWWLKYTNLALHLLCGTLVFWLAGRLFQTAGVRLAGGPWWAALWAAAAWLLAPLLVSTVLYAVQRMAQLAALFVLAGLLAYVIGRQQLVDRPRRGFALIGLALAVFWPLAVLSKQNGALLPLLALLVELFFFAGTAAPAARAARWLLVAVTAAPTLALAAKTALDPAWIAAGYTHRPFDLGERLLTQGRALFSYAANTLLLPGGRALGLYHDDYPKSAGLLAPPSTVLSWAAWLALAALAWRLRRRRLGLVLFGPVFFLAAHLVESTVFPLELYFEHRNYLPGVGLFLALALGATWLASRLRALPRRLLLAALVAVPLGYAALTHQRVLVWQSWERMLLVAEQTHPRSARVHAGLASLYINRRELSRAFAHLERAQALGDGRGRGGVALHYVSAYCHAPEPAPESAYARLEALAEMGSDPYTVNALAWLAGAAAEGICAGIDLARVAAALDRALQAARADPYGRRWLLHAHLARLLEAVGRDHRARAHRERAAALRGRE